MDTNATYKMVVAENVVYPTTGICIGRRGKCVPNPFIERLAAKKTMDMLPKVSRRLFHV